MLGPFGPYGLALSAVGALSVVLSHWLGFIQPPPLLHHYSTFPTHRPDADFWFPMGSFCTAVIWVGVLLILLRMKRMREKFNVGLLTAMALALVVFAVLSIVYHHRWSKWTFNYRGETVLMGNRYTTLGKADPRDGRDNWFGDFGASSAAVWTEEGLEQRQSNLGMLYLSTSIFGGVTLALLCFAVTQIRQKSKPKTAN